MFSLNALEMIWSFTCVLYLQLGEMTVAEIDARFAVAEAYTNELCTEIV